MSDFGSDHHTNWLIHGGLTEYVFDHDRGLVADIPPLPIGYRLQMAERCVTNLDV